jgi:hypothetical protein
MNAQEIYKQRIADSSSDYANSLALPEGDNRVIHSIDFCNGATFALQNQWISVEEALPDYNEAVIGIDYMPELDWDDQTIIFVHRSDNPNVVTDKNKFCVYPPTFRKVTHWMIIPSLEGGEK